MLIYDELWIIKDIGTATNNCSTCLGEDKEYAHDPMMIKQQSVDILCKKILVPWALEFRVDKFIWWFCELRSSSL